MESKIISKEEVENSLEEDDGDYNDSDYNDSDSDYSDSDSDYSDSDDNDDLEYEDSGEHDCEYYEEINKQLEIKKEESRKRLEEEEKRHKEKLKRLEEERKRLEEERKQIQEEERKRLEEERKWKVENIKWKEENKELDEKLKKMKQEQSSETVKLSLEERKKLNEERKKEIEIKKKYSEEIRLRREEDLRIELLEIQQLNIQEEKEKQLNDKMNEMKDEEIRNKIFEEEVETRIEKRKQKCEEIKNEKMKPIIEELLNYQKIFCAMYCEEEKLENELNKKVELFKKYNSNEYDKNIKEEMKTIESIIIYCRNLMREEENEMNVKYSSKRLFNEDIKRSCFPSYKHEFMICFIKKSIEKIKEIPLEELTKYLGIRYEYDENTGMKMVNKDFIKKIYSYLDKINNKFFLKKFPFVYELDDYMAKLIKKAIRINAIEKIGKKYNSQFSELLKVLLLLIETKNDIEMEDLIEKCKEMIGEENKNKYAIKLLVIEFYKTQKKFEELFTLLIEMIFAIECYLEF